MLFIEYVFIAVVAVAWTIAKTEDVIYQMVYPNIWCNGTTCMYKSNQVISKYNATNETWIPLLEYREATAHIYQL